MQAEIHQKLQPEFTNLCNEGSAIGILKTLSVPEPEIANPSSRRQSRMRGLHAGHIIGQEKMRKNHDDWNRQSFFCYNEKKYYCLKD